MKGKSILLIFALSIIGIMATIIINLDHGKSSALTTSNVSSSIDVEDKNIDWDTYTTNSVADSESGLTIKESGVYTLTGEINGQVVINTEGNVKLILDNVTIKSSNGPCILVQEAENVTIELKDGSTNTLTDSSNYTGYEEEDSTIFSHDDLELTGNGTLVVNSNYADAIVSKDDLTITSGTYKIKSVDDGIRGKDSVYIIDADITIDAEGDGIKSTNDTDEAKGYILVKNGTFNINAGNDGIQAETKLLIEGGTFTIKTTGNTKDDSAKGLKAGVLINVTGGKFNLSTTDDGVHSNKDLVISNGTFTIKSSDDAVHADGMVEINDGTFDITAHEGIEATYVKINDGTINISASDDGINAGDKSDEYKTLIEINGGNITITMGQGDTDGVDSNGDIVINGGTISVTGQSTFDYDGTGTINGGTVICNGEKVTSLPNQMMGGGMNQQRQGGVNRR